MPAGMTITSGTGNQLNVSPGLAASLANNGGPTQTLALLPGSAAISTGGALTSIATGYPVGTVRHHSSTSRMPLPSPSPLAVITS